MNYEKMIEKYRLLVEDGMDKDELFTRLKEQGAGIGDCLKLVRKLYGVSLGEAKTAMWGHSAWQADVTNNRTLEEEAISALYEAED